MTTLVEQLSEVKEESKKEAAFNNGPDAEAMNEIKVVGFSEYVKNLPGAEKAFDLEKKKLRRVGCMDDDIEDGGEHDVDIRSAGSGILLSDEEFDKFFKESGAKEMTSHNRCGAVEIAFAKAHPEIEKPSQEVVDEFGKDWARRKAKEKNVPYVDLGDLDRDYHGARVLYYDLTDRFSHTDVGGLPSGFKIGRRFMSEQASLAEVGVAENIAFGHHGFGELFTEENPFMLVVVANTEEELEESMNKLTELSKSFGGRVVVDGFLAPKNKTKK